MTRDKLVVPGPGNYAPTHQASLSAAPKYGFGSSKRQPLNGKSDTPGPGNYKVPSKVADLPAYATQGSDSKYKFV